MRLLIVSGIFHPKIGGPATYLHALSRTLAERGHQVGVVAYGATSTHQTRIRSQCGGYRAKDTASCVWRGSLEYSGTCRGTTPCGTSTITVCRR